MAEEDCKHVKEVGAKDKIIHAWTCQVCKGKICDSCWDAGHNLKCPKEAN